MSGLLENGSYPWIDTSFTGHLEEKPWVKDNHLYVPMGRVSRYWGLWQLLVHYGDEMQERMVEAAWWIRFSEEGEEN